MNTVVEFEITSKATLCCSKSDNLKTFSALPQNLSFFSKNRLTSMQACCDYDAQVIKSRNVNETKNKLTVIVEEFSSAH